MENQLSIRYEWTQQPIQHLIAAFFMFLRIRMSLSDRKTLLDEEKASLTYTSGYDKAMIANNAESMMNAFPLPSAVYQICVLINRKWKE